MPYRTTIPGLFRVRGLNDEDIHIILPSNLVADLNTARAAVNEAIIAANRVSKQGRDGGYFEALQESLLKYGVQTLAEIEVLGTRAWDDDCSDELGDVRAEENMTEVVIWNIAEVFEHGEDDRMLCEIKGESASASYAIDTDADTVLRLQVISMNVTFPRAERYGVPECCTDRGGREYLRGLGLFVPSSIEVNAMESGDDSLMKIHVTCKVPRELLRPVEVDIDSGSDCPL